MVVDPTGVKVPVKLGDFRSNRSQDVRLSHFVTNDDANRENAASNGVLPKNNGSSSSFAVVVSR